MQMHLLSTNLEKTYFTSKQIATSENCYTLLYGSMEKISQYLFIWGEGELIFVPACGPDLHRFYHRLYLMLSKSKRNHFYYIINGFFISWCINNFKNYFIYFFFLPVISRRQNNIEPS